MLQHATCNTRRHRYTHIHIQTHVVQANPICHACNARPVRFVSLHWPGNKGDSGKGRAGGALKFYLVKSNINANANVKNCKIKNHICLPAWLDGWPRPHLQLFLRAHVVYATLFNFFLHRIATVTLRIRNQSSSSSVDIRHILTTEMYTAFTAKINCFTKYSKRCRHEISCN